MAGDDDESLNVAPKTTEQHLIVRSDKSFFHDLLLSPVSQHTVWSEISVPCTNVP